ncbi:MAG TPA: c-type cytochrome [Thermoanaerobaculia bacterium]|nr:c-type cytochrome [Thermoanaerobaculia bacterium]
MKIAGVILVAALSLAALAAPPRIAPSSATPKDAAARPAPSGDAVLERGRYLVHDVALCVQCHSPRDENGNLLETKLLTGARVPFNSPYPGHPWAYQAPNIRGMIGYTEAEGVRLLTEGITRGGTPPRPPMQQFHMTADDARAVVAYLKSLH